MNIPYTSINKEWWEKMVREECGFTKPWLNIDQEILQQFATGKLQKVPTPLNEIYPQSIISNVQGKKVLCLAAGGGQQSAVFGLLGADVTVFDIAEAQLKNDKKAAVHYGYQIKTVQGNMCDLSALPENFFDLVYQASSMSYVPDAGKVYAEVSRVLRPGGVYRTDGHNPLAEFADESSWNGEGYVISTPYAVRQKKRAEDKNVIEFRHTLADVFNGLLSTGFVIQEVVEMPPDLCQEGDSVPGTWSHLLLYLPGFFAVVAKKK